MSNLGGVCSCWATAAAQLERRNPARMKHRRVALPFRELPRSDIESSGTRPAASNHQSLMRTTRLRAQYQRRASKPRPQILQQGQFKVNFAAANYWGGCV